MATNATDLDPHDGSAEARTMRGLRPTLAALALMLAVACGWLWMRFGAQVFLDAALFAWRACF